MKYPDLDVDARLTIWRKFFELAGCELWGGNGQPGDGRQSPDGYVKLEGHEPQCYVSLADLTELAAKPFNGTHSLFIFITFPLTSPKNIRSHYQESCADCASVGHVIVWHFPVWRMPQC